MLCNLGNWGMAAEDGPRLDAHSAVREFALHPKWRRQRSLQTCRSALRRGWRSSSFWRDVRGPSGCGRRHTRHRMPSAVPHGVRPALVASRACSCCCAPTGTMEAGGGLLRRSNLSSATARRSTFPHTLAAATASAQRVVGRIDQQWLYFHEPPSRTHGCCV